MNIPGRFYLWLKRHSKRDDIIGDFAGDAMRDLRFPQAVVGVEEIRGYLEDRSDFALEIFDEYVWPEYKRCGVARNQVTAALRFRILKRDNYRCCLCGRAAPKVVLEVDHRVAVAKGGTSDEENLMTLCFDCNRGKGTSDL